MRLNTVDTVMSTRIESYSGWPVRVFHVEHAVRKRAQVGGGEGDGRAVLGLDFETLRAGAARGQQQQGEFEECGLHGLQHDVPLIKMRPEFETGH